MNPETLKQLKIEALDELRNMFQSGANAKKMLEMLEGRESNTKLYKFYLEAACGQQLNGSIFLSHWNQESPKSRLEILGYLEHDLERIRDRDD